MTIEDDIQQKRFRNAAHKASLNLLFTHNWLLAKHKDFFQSFSITPQQYNILRILKGQYPQAISTSDIRKRMLDRNSDTSRMVDRLFRKKLLIKKPCPDDRRLVDVTITKQGLQLLDAIEMKVQELDALMNSLDQDELAHLNRLLDKVRI